MRRGLDTTRALATRTEHLPLVLLLVHQKAQKDGIGGGLENHHEQRRHDVGDDPDDQHRHCIVFGGGDD
jgi:hypothetical protein